MDIYDEHNNLRCRAKWLPWRLGREPGGKWYLCFSGHPVVHFRVLPEGRHEFSVDHWWSLLIIRFPSQETFMRRGTIRRVRPAQLQITLASPRGALSLFLIGRAWDLLRSGRSPVQFERRGFEG